MTPRLSRVDFTRTCRLIPTQYSYPAFDPLFDTDDELRDLADIEGATNERLLAQDGVNAHIGPFELVSRIPYASVINAAFTYASPEGGRFNTPDRGAWYASLDRETCLAEVIYHHSLHLAEIDYWHEEVQKDFWHADFHGDFHDIRDDDMFLSVLGEDPASAYPRSQRLAARLLEEMSAGIIFPSVRSRKGTNIACFRPALVDNVQKGETVTIRWDGRRRPEVM